MKIRKMVKKTFAAGVLALMACTSMSAMAEPEWVFVADVVPGGQRITGNTHGFDAVCARAGTLQPIRTTYLGSYSLDRKSSMVVYCEGHNDRQGYKTYSTAFSCPWNADATKRLGTFSYDRPDGCYEYIDCDPSLYARQAMPEACTIKPECNLPPNDSQCPAKSPFAGAEGAVYCGNNGKVICSWVDETYAQNCKAQAIIQTCIQVHEQQHIDNAVRFQSECRNDNFQATPGIQRYLGEAMGYAAEYRCLTESIDDCGNDSECRQNINDRIKGTPDRNGVQDASNTYRFNYCLRPGANVSECTRSRYILD